jgi:hypothetical protein
VNSHRSQRIYNELVQKNEEYLRVLKKYSEDSSCPLYEKLLFLITKEKRELLMEFAELLRATLTEERSQISALENSLFSLEREKQRLDILSHNRNTPAINQYSERPSLIEPSRKKIVYDRSNKFAQPQTNRTTPLPAINATPSIFGFVPPSSYVSPIGNLPEITGHHQRSKSSNRF